MAPAQQEPVHLPYCPPAVEDIVLWRDPKTAGIVLGSSVVAWFFLGPLSPLTGMQLLSLVVLIACPAFWAWQFAAPYLRKQGPPVPAFFHEGVSSKEIDQVAEPALKIINPILGVIGKLMSGQDVKLTVGVTVGAFFAFRLFRHISLLTLLFILVLLAFSLPKVYELKKADIDKVLGVVVAKAKELYAEVDKVVFKKVAKPAAKEE